MEKLKKLELTINTFGAGNFIHKDDKIIHYDLGVNTQLTLDRYKK